MPVSIIKIGQEIPDITVCTRNGAQIVLESTHSLFRGKRVVIAGIPGAFVSEYPSTMLLGYDLHYDRIKSLGIDEVYCTTTHDYFVMQNWFRFECVENVKLMPDGNQEWARQTGLLVDMSASYMGTRSHRYVMILDNNRLKVLFYENFSHDPHASFLETNAEKIVKYLERKDHTWERFSKEKR